MSNIHTGISNLISWSLQIIYQNFWIVVSFDTPPNTTPLLYSTMSKQWPVFLVQKDFPFLPFQAFCMFKKKKRQYQIIGFSLNSSCMHSESRFEKEEKIILELHFVLLLFLFRFCGLLSYPLDVSLKAEVWSSSDEYKGDRLCMHVQENFWCWRCTRE